MTWRDVLVIIALAGFVGGWTYADFQIDKIRHQQLIEACKRGELK